MERRNELRREIRRVLASLDERWIRAASHALSKKLSSLLNKEIARPAEHLLVWAAHFPGEPDLSLLIDDQLDRRRVYLPRCESDHRMRFFEIGSGWRNSLVAGLSGIPEPPDDLPEYDPGLAASTVVVVPGLAFDRSGNRLGRGKGFYDRFLGRNSMLPAEKIGAGWSMQLLPKLPFSSHDVGMDWICDEREYAAAVREES